MYYVALGDSISIDDYTGVPGGGAASQFARLVGADRFENLTRDGCTTDGVLENLERICYVPDVVTLTAGGNDFLQAAFWMASPEEMEGWNALVKHPLGNLERIATGLKRFACPVIVNTVYDPTDGDDTLAGQFGLISSDLRSAFIALNGGIRALALRHGFLFSDLEALFRGHGITAPDTWYVAHIEPNYAGATAIARHWFDLYSNFRERQDDH